MPFLIAGGLAAGGQILGGLLGSSAAKKRAAEQRGLHKQALGIYGDFMNDPNSYLTRGERSMQGALGAIDQGYAEAARNLGGIGAAARRTALGQAKQATAGMQQSMISRGLYGTTAFDNAQRGISSDLSRNLMNVNAQVGQMRAGLAQQQAMAKSSALQSLGSYQASAYGAKQNTMENYINLLRDKPAKFSSTAAFGQTLGQALGTFGQFYGMSAMMGGGAAPAAGPGAAANAYWLSQSQSPANVYQSFRTS
jgi:hypothetical protein